MFINQDALKPLEYFEINMYTSIWNKQSKKSTPKCAQIDEMKVLSFILWYQNGTNTKKWSQAIWLQYLLWFMQDIFLRKLRCCVSIKSSLSKNIYIKFKVTICTDDTDKDDNDDCDHDDDKSDYQFSYQKCQHKV